MSLSLLVKTGSTRIPSTLWIIPLYSIRKRQLSRRWMLVMAIWRHKTVSDRVFMKCQWGHRGSRGRRQMVRSRTVTLRWMPLRLVMPCCGLGEDCTKLYRNVILSSWIWITVRWVKIWKKTTRRRLRLFAGCVITISLWCGVMFLCGSNRRRMMRFRNRNRLLSTLSARFSSIGSMRMTICRRMANTLTDISISWGLPLIWPNWIGCFRAIPIWPTAKLIT